MKPVLLLLLLAACDNRDRLAAEATSGDPARGKQLIRLYGCGTCHEIPGVPGADGTVGPSLRGVANRAYLAGRLGNNPPNLIRWIEHPQREEPGVAMPEMNVSDEDAHHLAAYLYTLR